jgi:hypothetical protein
MNLFLSIMDMSLFLSKHTGIKRIYDVSFGKYTGIKFLSINS